MTTNAINAALSGLAAQQTGVQVTANNLANVNTNGFQASGVSLAERGGRDGVEISAIGRQLAQGSLQATGNALDLAIQGDGYFVMKDAAGNSSYTRNGSFQVDGAGYLADAGGRRVQGTDGDIQVGSGAVSVGADGTVSITNSDGTKRNAGTLLVAQFANAGGLAAAGGSQYTATANSGGASTGTAGVAGRGTLVAGYREMANVDLAKEMTNLIVDEKAFAANLTTIKAQDEMLGEVLDLKQ